MKTYQKLSLFLVRLTCVVLMLWSALRVIQTLATVMMAGFRLSFEQFAGAMCLAASPLVAVLVLHWSTEAVVRYLSRGLDE